MSYTAEDLDRYITGNYGEDYFKGIEEDLECECGKAAYWDCATCLDDYCEACAESHILNHHEIGWIKTPESQGCICKSVNAPQERGD